MTLTSPWNRPRIAASVGSLGYVDQHTQWLGNIQEIRVAEALEKYIAELQQLASLQDERSKGSIRWYIAWYEKRFPLRRWVYRVSGAILLLIALLAASQLKNGSLWSPESLAALAAFVIGLNAFFASGTAWRTYFLAKVRLEFLLQGWAAKLIEARNLQDDTKAIEVVNQAFEEFIQKSGQAIEEEAKGFFDSLKFPSLK